MPDWAPKRNRWVSDTPQLSTTEPWQLQIIAQNRLHTEINLLNNLGLRTLGQYPKIKIQLKLLLPLDQPIKIFWNSWATNAITQFLKLLHLYTWSNPKRRKMSVIETVWDGMGVRGEGMTGGELGTFVMGNVQWWRVACRGMAQCHSSKRTSYCSLFIR